jgi:carbonic anhydrase
MDPIDTVLAAGEAYARDFSYRELRARPVRGLVVVACMDARMHLEEMLGLEPGDAHILRNAGGIVTEDVLRSLVISQQLLDTRAIMIVNHTDCGLLTFRDEELRERLRRQTGVAAVAPSCFHAFSSLEENVREQIQKVRSHPWIMPETLVRGFVYDVRTGRLAEVVAVQG